MSSLDARNSQKWHSNSCEEGNLLVPLVEISRWAEPEHAHHNVCSILAYDGAI